MANPHRRDRRRHREPKPTPLRPQNLEIIGMDEAVPRLLTEIQPHLKHGLTGWFVLAPTEAIMDAAKRAVAANPLLDPQEATNEAYKKATISIPFRLPRPDEASLTIGGVVFFRDENGAAIDPTERLNEMLMSAAMMGVQYPSKVHLSILDNQAKAEVFSLAYAIEIRLVASGRKLIGVFDHYALMEDSANHTGEDGFITKSGLVLPR